MVALLGSMTPEHSCLRYGIDPPPKLIYAALCSQVFVYLAELNQRKQQAGPPPEEQHAQQPKQQSQQQAAPARVITVDSGENNDDERARTVDLAPSRKRTKGKKTFKVSQGGRIFVSFAVILLI